MSIISTKYARALIASGKAERQYAPLVCCTKERELDKLYAVLVRTNKNGDVHFDHYVA